jgi:hypothetical protein
MHHQISEDFMNFFTGGKDKTKVATERKILEEELWTEYDKLVSIITTQKSKRPILLHANANIYEMIAMNKDKLHNITNKFNQLFKNKRAKMIRILKKRISSGNFHDVIEASNQKERMNKTIKELKSQDAEFVKARNNNSE